MLIDDFRAHKGKVNGTSVVKMLCAQKSLVWLYEISCNISFPEGIWILNTSYYTKSSTGLAQYSETILQMAHFVRCPLTSLLSISGSRMTPLVKVCHKGKHTRVTACPRDPL